MALALLDYVEEIDDEENEEDIMRLPRKIRPRLDALAYYSDGEFRERFRMHKPTAILLLHELLPDIPFINKNACITPFTQLLITLRYF